MTKKEKPPVKHTVVFRGNQPIASVNHDEKEHDAQVSRAMQSAHRQNALEGSSAEVKIAVTIDGETEEK